MKTSRARGWLLSIVLLCAGCGVAITTHPLNPMPGVASPRPGSAVEMFTSGPPPFPHVEVAIIEARQASDMSGASTNDVFDQMRDRAGAMGCDGLILLGSNDSVVSATTFDPKDSSVRTLHGYRGTCIVKTGAAPAAVAAPAPATPAAPAAPAACTPICSPGYTCRAGACVAECNPACTAPQVCGNDRVCR